MKTYVTFGQAHVHKFNDTLFDKDCVAVVEGDWKRVREIFGTKYCFDYTEESFDMDSMKYFPRGFISI